MSDFLQIDIEENRKTGLLFDELPDTLTEELRKEIDALTDEVFGRVLARVPEKTGKLRSQIMPRVFVTPAGVTGMVRVDGKGSGPYSDFAKAGALEYGSTGEDFKVKAHPMRLDHVLHEKLAAPITVMVKQLDRASSIAEHAFMRGALNGMRPEIIERLRSVVERVVGDANDE